MKKPILILIAFFVLIASTIAQIKCALEGPSIVCQGERVTIQFESDTAYTQIKIDAFTVTNGTQVLAIQENINDNSADIIFLAGGDAEIVVRFLNNNSLTSICNLNVFVLDEEPIPALGMLSNFVDDQVTCEALDLSFEMFIICPDCPFYWTLNDQIIELDQQISVDGTLQLINAELQVEGVGSYTFCQHILKQDSSCFAKDCISLDIVELEVSPAFSLDEQESIFCMGSSLHFFNETEIEEDVVYIWEVKHDSLLWRYSGEELDFKFQFPGTYSVSLQYYIVSDENCISDKTSMIVEIADSPLIAISCSSNSCQDSIFTYQAPIECAYYEWIIDESLGQIISNDSSGITIKWNEVDKYTETKINLLLDSCSEDVCQETFRDIVLFPNEIAIEGPRGICDKGTEWYEADFIPNAEYIWEIEMIDSISGTAPQITKIEDNRVRITYNSFVGNLAIRVKTTLADKNCEAYGEFIASSLFILTNDDLCTGDLFKASVLPRIDQDVVWTLTNESTGYFKRDTISGQDNFLAFDLNVGGEYILNVAVPVLDFACGEDIPLTVLDVPEVDLIGPLYICPGDSVAYTLAGLGANDNVVWNIFQNNTSSEMVGNEIKVLWIEGGEPYTIKVTRSTEVMPGQFCDSDNFIFELTDIENQVYEILGPEVVCYDGQGAYQIANFNGEFHWEIDPPYMGTIIEGDSTELITIQWHYAPDIPFATLSTSHEVCDSIYNAEIDVYFEPYVPVLSVPDSICHNTFEAIEILELETFQTIDIYVDGVLVRENKLGHTYYFEDTGFVDILVEVVNPNGCPGTSILTKTVFVIPILEFNILTTIPIAQCPKEDFQTTIAEVDYQDEEAYYIWDLDGVIIKEGFGNPDLYTFEITAELIFNDAGTLSLQIIPREECPSSRRLVLRYQCEQIKCVCIDDVVGQVEYLNPLECNLVNFGGSLDFSSIDDPYWSINLPDTNIIIPIFGPEDLIQDSFYFDEGSAIGQVALRGSCDGLIVSDSGEIIDSSVCNIFIDEMSIDLYSPDFVREYICNEDFTYDIILTEKILRNASPPFSSTVSWVINGVSYEGISIELENQVGGSPLLIEMTQCNLEGTYCCTRKYETTVRKEFSPNIILPNGSCENDLWLFTLDVNQNDIESVLWDFGDGSGSTLLLTEKGFLDTLAHDISVIVTDNLGCVATAEITVASFPNNIAGEIQFESDPCASFANLTYSENSESIITNYNWDINNPLDTSTVQVYNSGDYFVTVTDNHGCTDVASVLDIKVNESFSNGIRFKPENCGVAAVSLFANPDYTYTWYVDEELVNTGSSILISMAGEHEIKVTSTSVITNELCDSVTVNLIVFPSPQAPIILEEKIFCSPFITELSLQNYPSALWNSNVDLQQEAPSILVSQNGTYKASVIDENGCIASTNRVINEQEINFDPLSDLCIQACREDLDSLQITIPGISESFSSWAWVTVDTFGVEYEVDASSGFVSPLTITSDMYDYVQLQVTQDDCVLRSDRIPLDLALCAQPEPPIEINCESIDSDHASCGQSIYKCLLSEENGGPKLYFEGSVILPMGAYLCSEDSLSVSLNNGQITITELLLEEDNGKIMAFYSANILIADADDYQENGAVIKFDFCNEEGEVAYCYEYSLPFRTCNKDFNCLIDYEGVSSGDDNTININYCLNLSHVVQDNCTLSKYEIRALISGDVKVKTIYTQVLEGDFNNLHCISIPVSQEDFFGGEYQCIELFVTGDCPSIFCSEFQCGIFGNSYTRGTADAVTKLKGLQNIRSIDYGENSMVLSEQFLIYPNPSTGIVTFEIDGKYMKPKESDSSNENWIIIKNTVGQEVSSFSMAEKTVQIKDLSNHIPGLYFATFIKNEKVVSVRKFLLIN